MSDIRHPSTESIAETTVLKIIAVGDVAAGKTCILYTHASKTPPAYHTPIVFDNYHEVITHDGVKYDISLWDTAGQEEYEKLRSLSYSSSYDNILSTWYPDLKRYCSNVPIIVVATNCHLRGTSEELVTLKEGKKLTRKIKACKHMECSAVEYKGVSEIFDEAKKRAIKRANKRRTFSKSCAIQ